MARGEKFRRAARELADLGFGDASASRAYYAMFHAAKAVLLELGIERSSHHGLWAAFGQHVSNTGLMDRRYHRECLRAFRVRLRSDYDASPNLTESDIEDTRAAAADFVAACRRFLETRTRKEES
jgi:uncharacterized protein (UPF0332 family)